MLGGGNWCVEMGLWRQWCAEGGIGGTDVLAGSLEALVFWEALEALVCWWGHWRQWCAERGQRCAGGTLV